VKWKERWHKTKQALEKNKKYDDLLKWFGNYDHAAVAFSGGVDSTFVLAAAQEAYGSKVLALTVKTPYIPDWELEEAIEFCKAHNIRHRIVQAGIIPEIQHNPENRCYLCKRHLFALLKEEALKDGFTRLFDGTNFDDSGMYRPGLKALQELCIESPLLIKGFRKADIRHFSALKGLPTADKPSYACLLTRLPYNYEIKTEELERIERAEKYLISLGFGASRVRNHGNIARIEIPLDKMAGFVGSEKATMLTTYFHKLGYEFIALDLEGYRSGSFDKDLNKEQHESE
jgi:pyridinium-3,5-biscarboxylic acid mononucleotide sulfurtransferase